MAGLICLQGGLELTPPCREMDATILDRAPDGRVAVLAGAARIGSDYAGACERARAHYTSLGASVTCLVDPRVDVDGALAALSDDLALVVLPGGSPSSLLDVLAGSTPQIGRRLVALHAAGVALSGASAGAMVLCDRTVLPDRRSGDGPSIADGLGLVRGLALPHWSPDRTGWPVPDDVDVWGLPECGGALIEGDTVTAVGRNDAARRPAGEAWAPLPRR